MLENPSSRSENSKHLCPVCQLPLEPSLGAADRFRCANDKCAVTSVLFRNDQPQYFTKFKRTGEEGSVYFKMIRESSLKTLVNHNHSKCAICGIAFVEGDVATLAPEDGSNSKRSYVYFHESCYEKMLVR